MFMHTKCLEIKTKKYILCYLMKVSGVCTNNPRRRIITNVCFQILISKGLENNFLRARKCSTFCYRHRIDLDIEAYGEQFSYRDTSDHRINLYIKGCGEHD